MQTDFLADLVREPGDGTAAADDAGPAVTAAFSSADDEAQANRLEQTGRFRVLRRLEHRSVRLDVAAAAGDGKLRVGIAVDVETTGLDHRRDEAIEIAAVAFAYDRGCIRDVVGVFQGLQQPSRGVPREITRLTGLTDADVRGRSIDRVALADFVGRADLVIAHNASFDRPFCERLAPVFAEKAWACSATDVDWKAVGADSAKLSHLLADVGYFHGAHRALDDVYALLEVLSAPSVRGCGGAFARLVEASSAESYELRAERTPYDMRTVLKERGYRWSNGMDGRPKAWVKTVDKAAYGSELHWLRYEIYRDENLPLVRKLGAVDRFRS